MQKVKQMKRRAVSRARNRLNQLVQRQARPRHIRRAETVLETREAVAELRQEREDLADNV